MSVSRRTVDVVQGSNGTRVVPDEYRAALDAITRAQKVLGRDALPKGLHASTIRAHAERRDLRIAAVGITKAGKSTLINAIVGAELLPSPNIPSTARPVLIAHDGALSRTAFRVDGENFASVHDAYARLAAIHDAARAKRAAFRSVCVEARVAAFADVQSSVGFGFTLVDTPGVTESDAARLQDSTIQQVSDADVLIVVLSYAEQGSAAERDFISSVARLRPDFFLRPDRRLFIALTKADRRNRHGKDRLSTAEYLRHHIEQALQKTLPQLECAVWELHADVAVLAHALLAEPTAAQVADYGKYLFGARETPTSKDVLRRHAQRSLDLSGVPRLATAIRQRVLQNAPWVRRDAVRSRLIHAGRKTLRAAARQGRGDLATQIQSALTFI